MYSLGIGKFALAAKRSITAYNRGDSSRPIGTAPLDFNAILSEKKYAPPFISTANTSAIAMPFDPPSASPIKSRSNVNAVNRNAVLRVFMGIQPWRQQKYQAAPAFAAFRANFISPVFASKSTFTSSPGRTSPSRIVTLARAGAGAAQRQQTEERAGSRRSRTGRGCAAGVSQGSSARIVTDRVSATRSAREEPRTSSSTPGDHRGRMGKPPRGGRKKDGRLRSPAAKENGARFASETYSNTSRYWVFHGTARKHMNLTIRTKLTALYFVVLAASFSIFVWISDVGFRRSIEVTVNDASSINLQSLQRLL